MENTATSPWHLTNGTARLLLPRFEARIALAQSEVGVHGLRVDESSPAVRLMQVTWSVDGAALGPVPSESYVRGDDLVATFPERVQQGLQAQLYWRNATHRFSGALAAIELVAAVKTSQLDSDPSLTAVSELAVSEAWQLMDAQRQSFVKLVAGSANRSPVGGQQSQCALVRLADSPFSYVEMVHPGDAGETQTEVTRRAGALSVRLSHRLLGDWLEKGVILKSPVLGIVLERTDDQALALRHYGDFAAQGPPLTT